MMPPLVSILIPACKPRRCERALGGLALDLVLLPLPASHLNEARDNLPMPESEVHRRPAVCSGLRPCQTGRPPALRLPNRAARWLARWCEAVLP